MKDDRLYLYHMLERCHRIARFIGPGRDAFMASEELQDAVICNVEVIGEAAKRVSAGGRSRLAQLDWKAICGRSLERCFRPDTRTPSRAGAVPEGRKPRLAAAFMTGTR